MGNWFAERLGPPPQALHRFDPRQPSGPVAYPPGSTPYQPPSYNPQQFVQPQQQQQQQPVMPSTINNVEELLAYKDMWRGTAEQNQHTALCPKCGGPLQTYTQPGAPKIMNRDGQSCHPMERCHYCGYNGHFEQLGQQATDSGVAVRAL